MIRTAFQVVELALDTFGNVVDRRAIPYAYPTRKDAVDTIEKFTTKFCRSGYDPQGDFWWGMSEDGTNRVRFVIERV